MGTQKNNTFSITQLKATFLASEIAVLPFSSIKRHNNQVEGASQTQLTIQITSVFFMWSLLLWLQCLSVDFRSRLTFWLAGGFQSRHSATLAERRLMNCLGGEGCACPLEPYSSSPTLPGSFTAISQVLFCWAPCIGRHWRCKQFMWRETHRLLGFSWNTPKHSLC